MTVESKSRELPSELDFNELKPGLPPCMPVKHLYVKEDVDWDGYDVIRVTVVLDDSVDVEDGSVTGKDVLNLQRVIQDKIREYGREEFVYVHFATETELKEDRVDPLEEEDDVDPLE